MAPEDEPTPSDDAPAAEADACGGWHNGRCRGTPHCPPRCPRAFDDTGTPVLVEPPAADDWDRLAGMYESIGATTMGLPPATAGGIESWLGTLCEHGWNLLARRTGRVVGHISVAPADATAPEIVVFVHDDYHGHGIGTELVKQAIARAEDHGHESLTLTVDPGNRAAVSIYCDTGFEVESADVSLEMRLPMHKPVVEAVQRPPADR